MCVKRKQFIRKGQLFMLLRISVMVFGLAGLFMQGQAVAQTYQQQYQQPYQQQPQLQPQYQQQQLQPQYQQQQLQPQYQQQPQLQPQYQQQPQPRYQQQPQLQPQYQQSYQQQYQPQAPQGQGGGVVMVQILPQHNFVVLGGTVVPAREVTIAAQLPGRVEYIAGEEGDGFDEGSKLVALDDDELLAKRQAAIAQIGNADAAMRNAGVQFHRELESPQSRNTMSGMGLPGMFDQMFTRNFSDMAGYQSPGTERRADLYTRSTGVEQARNAMVQAQSQLREIDAKLRDAIGYAPFRGVIVKKFVEIGDTVQPGQPLLKFSDTDLLQIQLEVPARLMPGVRDGQLLMATLDVRNTAVQATVSQIYPMADARRHTVTVKLDLPADAPAGPGMYVEVMVPDINSPVQSYPIVPVSALVQRGSLPAVFVVKDSGEKELRVVRTGEKTDPYHITILSGLTGGERIISQPTPGMTSH
jgi:multidrug efflux pump subunit AcrA (membrane-fusion protein)